MTISFNTPCQHTPETITACCTTILGADCDHGFTVSSHGCSDTIGSVNCIVCVQDKQGGADAPQPVPQSTKASKKTAGKATAAAAASKAEKAAEQQRQARLELLMMDDSALQDVARLGEPSLHCDSACHIAVHFVRIVSYIFQIARLE